MANKSKGQDQWKSYYEKRKAELEAELKAKKEGTWTPPEGGAVDKLHQWEATMEAKISKAQKFLNKISRIFMKAGLIGLVIWLVTCLVAFGFLAMCAEMPS